MNSKTLWTQRLGMLAACGSPGSALAYHLGLSVFEPGIPRRNIATETSIHAGARIPALSGIGKPKPAAADPSPPPARNWLAQAFHRLENWSWEREMREREAYLARSQDLCDLEARMRHLDGDTLARGRALR